MSLGEWLQVIGTVVPIIAAVIWDGIRTRIKIAVIETKQADDRRSLDEHRRDAHAHWAIPRTEGT